MHRTPTLALAAIAACALAAPASAQVTTTAGGEVVSISQKNVVDHQIVADSIEVETAKMAASKTQNASVRDFANMLVADHTAHLEALHKLAGKKDIGREANAADTSSAHLARITAELQAMPAGPDFDKAFIQAEIEHHQMAIAGLETFKPAAKDDDLKKDLDATAATLQKHLSRANEVAGTLGTPAGTPPAKPPR